MQALPPLRDGITLSAVPKAVSKTALLLQERTTVHQSFRILCLPR